MAKNAEKKRVTRRTVIEETGDDTGNLDGGELEIPAGQAGGELVDPDELDGIAKLRALAGGESLAKFEVRRVLPSAFAGYVGTLGDEELTLERLAEEFGPGTYTVRVRLPTGKYAGSDRVQIAELPKHKQPPPQPVVSQQPAADNGVPAMIAAMQRSTDAQVNMLSGLVKSLIERPLPQPPAPPPPPDTISILTLASKLFGDRKESGSAFDQFLKGVEFGKELGGGGETDLGDVLLKGIDGLKDLSAATSPQARPAARRLPPPGTVPAIEGPARAPAAAPTQAQPAGGKMNTLQLIQWLGKQVQHLLVQASRGKSPELYAEVFLDNLPPGLEDATILEHLKAPDAMEKLAKLDRRVLQFRPWFEAWGAEVVSMIEAGPDDEDEDAEDDAPDAGPGDMPAEFPGGGEGGAEGGQ